MVNSNTAIGLPRWLNGKESCCQYRRCMFDPWFGKIPWRRKWQPTPVFFLGNSVDKGVWGATVHWVAEKLDPTVTKTTTNNTAAVTESCCITSVILTF